MTCKYHSLASYLSPHNYRNLSRCKYLYLQHAPNWFDCCTLALNRPPPHTYLYRQCRQPSWGVPTRLLNELHGSYNGGFKLRWCAVIGTKNLVVWMLLLRKWKHTMLPLAASRTVGAVSRNKGSLHFYPSHGKKNYQESQAQTTILANLSAKFTNRLWILKTATSKKQNC